GTRRVTPRQRYSIYYRHSVNERITSRRLDLAEDEERPVVQDLHIDARIDEIVLAVSLGDQAFRLADALAADFDLADQRQRDDTLVVHVEIAGEVLLVVDGDADLVAGAQPVGADLGNGGSPRHEEHRAGKNTAQQRPAAEI